MANELTGKQADVVTAITGNSLGDILKPLTGEIHLFDSFIAGTTHLDDPAPLAGVAVGDALTLRREDNAHDRHAILVLDAAGRKLGYVPARDNLVFSRLMDAGKLLCAKVTEIQQKRAFKRISVGIFLVDF